MLPDGVLTKLIKNNYARTTIECLRFCLTEINCKIIEIDNRHCFMYESFNKTDRSDNKTYFMSLSNFSTDYSGNFLSYL